MNQYLEALITNRSTFLEAIKGLTEAQYNEIPEGYNNNIVWNMGHMLVVSENILYKNSAYRPPIVMFDRSQFGRNTKPEQPLSLSEITLIRDALLDTSAAFIATTGAGNTDEPEIVTSDHTVPEERLQFLLFHDSIHIRTAVRYMRMIINK